MLALRVVKFTAAKAILRRLRKNDLPMPFTARDIHQRDWSGLTEIEGLDPPPSADSSSDEECVIEPGPPGFLGLMESQVRKIRAILSVELPKAACRGGEALPIAR